MMKGRDKTLLSMRRVIAEIFVAIVLGSFVPLFFFATGVAAQDTEEMRTLSGRVVNGTEGGEAPAGLTVFALVIDEDAESIVERVESVTEADGSFAIDVARVSGGRFYRVVADDGVYTPFVDLLPADAGKEITLTVYDRTASLDEISVTTYSIVIPAIDEDNEVLGVLAAVNLVNSGDEVYLADLTDPNLTGFNLMRFNLPAGFQQLTVESDLPSGNVMEIDTGFAISNPVPPGEYSMVISYSASFADGVFEYPFRLPFGAKSVTVLIPEGSGEVTGLGLTRADTAVIGDARYVQYEGSSYERRAELGLRITGLPRPNVTSQFVEFLGSDEARIAIVASVVIAMLGIVAYVVVLSRRQVRASAAGGVVSDGDFDGDLGGDSGGNTRSHLVMAIAELDEMHELGKIEEAEYMGRRRQLVQQVIDAEGDPPRA